MSQPRPNTFIVGAPKCGTSSLHDYLDQHPDVYMSRSIKEPNYFSPELKVNEYRRPRTLEAYLDLFSAAGSAKRVGESSVWYLLSDQAAKNIRVFDPAARIIIMLRSPVDAAYSLHGQFIWACNEDILDFEQALAAEDERRQGKRIPDTCTSPSGLIYTDVFSFHPQVKRYFDTFPREQVKVIIFEDFVKDTPRVYRETLEFLGLPNFAAKLEVVNAAKPVALGVNRFFGQRPALRSIVHRFVPAAVQRKIVDALPYFTKTLKREAKISPELRSKLAPRFREDIEKLSELLGRDLTHWTKPR
ncbi:MAG: sulfotransferase [Tepidisphaeraceae bacterium]|jgi:hypothetical protein